MLLARRFLLHTFWKIVVIVRGSPSNGYDWSDRTSRDSTMAEATRRGAAGILLGDADGGEAEEGWGGWGEVGDGSL